MNKICVLIPYYNSLSDLYASVTSIGEHEKVDVLIVDDGSEMKIDRSRLKEIFRGEGQINVFEYLPNKGIEVALNTGLKLISEEGYEFIARLDCGDTVAADRFSKQLALLERDSKLHLIGTGCRVVDENDKFLYNIIPPASSSVIEKRMYLNVMFIHPSVMFRTAVIKDVGYYPTAYKAAEDYAFFFRIIKRHASSNLQEILTTIKINGANSISKKNRNAQIRSRIKVIRENFYFGYYPIMGLLRNLILLAAPVKLILSIKKRVWSGY
jgi:glycosyltransferase involved in cell wall biosynthesis